MMIKQTTVICGLFSLAMLFGSQDAQAYSIVHVYSGLCLEDTGGSWASLEPCNGDDSQQWFETSYGNAWVIFNDDTGK